MTMTMGALGVWRARVRRATAFCVVAVLSGHLSAAAQQIRGFTPAAATRQLALEAKLAKRLSRDSTGAFFRHFTALPHPAGSDRNRELAEYVAERFRRYGWEDVQVRRYDVLLPWPERVKVTMTAPTRFEASLTEDGYPVDRDSYADPGPTFLGMSASGDVTGQLIYANSGNPADYDWLKAHGVDPRGKIALVRYSNPYSYRGFKALTAQRYGLQAMLIYSDPAEDGASRGPTFPTGPWGPESHIQRGAISYDFIVPGDPLTPGWPSLPGARRIPEAESKAVPRIVAVPMSARDAQPLLEALRGPEAPPEWQGGLPIKSRIGSGPAVVRVEVKMDGKIRPIWNVEARIRGSEAPDQLVVLGNHRDAWVFGAVDPSSGSATQLELARGIGQLVAQGHRPKRTIVMNSWDAEEWHLTGSTEWGEQFADRLGRGAVAYLNVDGSTSGPSFGASAVASLNPLVLETARDVPDPSGQGTLLDAWSRDEKVPATQTDPLRLVDNKLGSGSDYTVFLNHLGVPIVDMAFSGPYGVYHSIYDDYYWMAHFGDPGFLTMTAMAEVWGRMALRLANAEVLPYDTRLVSARLGQFLDELGRVPAAAKLDLRKARAAHEALDATARRVEGIVAAVASDPVRRARINRALIAVERAWLLPDGIPGRPWFRHALYAPKYTYAAMELPGIREAVDQGDLGLARKQVDRLVERIKAVERALSAAGS